LQFMLQCVLQCVLQCELQRKRGLVVHRPLQGGKDP